MAADIVSAARAYSERGFAVHWLRAKSKAPIEAGWNDVAVLTSDQLAAKFRPGSNVGFRAGKFSRVDGRPICVLDVDVRGGAAYQQEALAAAEAVLGRPIDYDVVSGSEVGRHKYLTFPEGQAPDKAATVLVQSAEFVSPTGAVCEQHEKGAKRAWMVELLSSGKNVVLPPSIHPDTEKPYRALRDLADIEAAPSALLDHLAKLSAGPDWEAPEKLGRDLTPALPITEDMLPASIREWCVDIAHRMQCPLEFIAVSAIAMFGSIVGAGCAIRPKQKDNWTGVANLWGAIIARPGRLILSRVQTYRSDPFESGHGLGA